MAKNTKEVIKITAIDLFSKFGFAGTSIRHIAKIVGIRESAIYNHFNSKEEIITHVLTDYQKNSSGKRFLTNELLDKLNDPPKFLLMFSEKLLTHWNADYERKIIRILLFEQFRDSSAGKISLEDFIIDLRKIWEMIFHEMIKYDFIQKADPAVLANEFIAPLFFIRIEYISDENGKKFKKAITQMKKHVDFFWNAIKREI